MVDVTKPVYGDVWANTGEKLAPDSAKIATGWIQEMMPYQYENFLQNRTDTAITYLLQKGVAEWSSDQEYIANKSVVTYGGQLYMATATTTNVLPTVTASWKKLSVSFGANGAIPVSFGGTGATTAVDARTNLGIGSAATANLPAGNGMLVKLTDNTLVARSVAGTTGYITVTNGDGVAGNPTINVGANVAKTDADAAWTTTSSIRLPAGSTAQRGAGSPGRIRFNLETGVYEGYDNTGWNPIGSVGALDVQNFQGDGVRTTFTLSSTPRAENNTQVYFNGVYQQKNTYNLVGNDLVFDEAPTSDISIEVVNVSSVPIGTTTAAQTSIVDSGNYYNSSNVEGALQYVGETVSKAILTFPDYATASAAATTLHEGQVIEVAVDETLDGHRTRYAKNAGALNFVVNLDLWREYFGSIAKDRGENQGLISFVSISDFGGVDDCPGDNTGTNNLNAFASAIAYLNSVGGGDLILPRTATGIYFINGDDPTQVLAPVRLVPASGVSIRLIYSGGAANSPLVNTELKSATQIPIYFANFGFTSYVGGNVGKQLGDILPTVNNGDGVFAKPIQSPASEWTVISLASPLVPIAPSVATNDALTFSGAGESRCAVKSADVGDEVFTLLSSPLGGTFFAGVITAKGVAYLSQNSGSQNVVYRESTDGSPPIILGVPYSEFMNQQRDNFNNALISVKITSSRTFSVLVNGLVVYSAETRSSITGVAFGTEDINADITLSQMSVVKACKSFGGIKPLNIVMVGDSITDDNVQYSHAKYLQMMLGSAGISVAQINNIAVSGETAAQQYARLQTVDAGYDLCCIQVGVNDVQAGTGYSAFISTIIGMCNYAKSVGMQPIVAIPTAFYSQAEAQANGQSGGQNTSNNAALHSYRALLIRAVAAAGGLLNLETMKAYGAMSAKWLSVVPYSSGDRIVCDNIHPTPYGSMMIAQGWARSIIGWAMRPDATKAEAFEEIPSTWLKSGFGTSLKPSLRAKELKGSLSLSSSPNPDGAVAFTLPAWMAPSTVLCKPVVAINSSGLPVGTCSIYIGTEGNVYFFALPNGTVTVNLDGITF